MPLQAFLQLRLEILRDPALQESLRDIPDEAAFFEKVLALGRERGYDFSIQDLQTVVQANQHNWICRGLFQ
jgi:hypothetical protein